MTGNDHDETELAALYALDALEPSESATFEQHLADCADCQAAVREFQDTMASLAGAEPVAPSSTLRSQVLEAIESVDQLPKITPREESPPELVVVSNQSEAPPRDDAAQPIDRRRGERRRRRVAALLGVAAAVAVIAAAAVFRSVDRPTPAEEIISLADGRSVELSHAVPSTARIEFVFAASAARGVLQAENLPELDPGQVYEFWLIDDAGAHPAGLFSPDDAGQAELIVETVAASTIAVGVTIEPEQGSDAPTSPVIFSTEL